MDMPLVIYEKLKITRLLALFHDDEEIKPFLEQLARLIKSEGKE